MAKFLDSEGLKYLWSKIDDKFLAKADVIKNIQGVVDATASATATTLTTNASKLDDGEYYLYVLSDSTSVVDGTAVTINDTVATTISASSKGISAGDYLLQSKSGTTVSYQIIHTGLAKASDGSYPGTSGYMSAWDKAQVNKIPTLASTLSDFAAKGIGTCADANDCLNTGYWLAVTTNTPDSAVGIVLVQSDSLEGDTGDDNVHTLTQIFIGASSGSATMDTVGIRLVNYTINDSGSKTIDTDNTTDWVVLTNPGVTATEILSTTNLTTDSASTFDDLVKKAILEVYPEYVG